MYNPYFVQGLLYCYWRAFLPNKCLSRWQKKTVKFSTQVTSKGFFHVKSAIVKSFPDTAGHVEMQMYQKHSHVHTDTCSYPYLQGNMCIVLCSSCVYWFISALSASIIQCGLCSIWFLSFPNLPQIVDLSEHLRHIFQWWWCIWKQK